MKTFIKVTEIWILDKDRALLEFGSGLYGSLIEFKNASEEQRFAYGEGLPGKAWAAGHPIVLTQFDHSYFKRTEAAHQAGLTCGIALPIFSGDFLLAVVVFLCGDDEELAGAIEVWSSDSEDKEKLGVTAGYYGILEHFENMSKLIKLTKGNGMAGMAWATGMPILIEDISQTNDFIRAGDAQQAGITTGLAIPVANYNEQCYVMTFLSAKATPLAKRIQLWIPENDELVCRQGFSKSSNNLAEIFENITVKKGVGALGRTWLTGMPSISGNKESSLYNTDLDILSSMLTIPVIQQGKLKAIVTFLF
ncbi:hypothetical protein MCAMS1_00009 [biofilm metagenome]